MIILKIPGIPIAKKRPRFARKGNFTQTYNDQQTEEGLFLFYCREQLKYVDPIIGGVGVLLNYYMKRPKNHFGTGRNEGKLKSSAPKYHTKKPDIDNLNKFVFDCLNKYTWKDDSQIVLVFSEKKYAEDNPRTEIIINNIDNIKKML